MTRCGGGGGGLLADGRRGASGRRRTHEPHTSQRALRALYLALLLLLRRELDHVVDAQDRDGGLGREAETLDL